MQIKQITYSLQDIYSVKNKKVNKYFYHKETTVTAKNKIATTFI